MMGVGRLDWMDGRHAGREMAKKPLREEPARLCSRNRKQPAVDCNAEQWRRAEDEMGEGMAGGDL